MNLWFRMLSWLLTYPFLTRIDPLGTSRLSLRVWPTDLDLNMHMNNGRFLTLMDLGRVDLMARTGMARVILQRRWRPVAGAINIRYLKPLAPFATFKLDTRVLGWDGKWLYLEQSFRNGDQLVAQAYFKGLLLDAGGAVPAEEVVRAAGHSGASPTLSPELLESFRTGNS